MLSKIILFTVLLFLGNEFYTWLIQVDSTLLYEISRSILIALVLQPFVMYQFR